MRIADMGTSASAARFGAPGIGGIVAGREVDIAGVGSIRVNDRLGDLAEEWRAFEMSAVCTPYQRFDWLDSWIDHISARECITPKIFRLYSPSGALMAILPFGLDRNGPFRTAGWLGDKHMNYFMGLFAKDAEVDEVDWNAVLREAARMAGIDVYVLKNQPRRWMNFENPIACLRSRPSPSQAYSATLTGDFQEFLKTRPDGRWKRQLRTKVRKLEESGRLEIVRETSCTGAADLLETYFHQKARRLSQKGIHDPFEPPHVRAFFRDVVCRQTPENPLLELYGLKQNGKVLAIYAGSCLHGRFSTSICSITDGPQSQFTPGEILLKALIEDRCRRGDQVIDLGIGESRVKSHWCPNTDGLFDTFVPVTPHGHLCFAMAVLARGVKRQIKQSPRVWSFYMRLRSRMGKKPTISPID